MRSTRNLAAALLVVAGFGTATRADASTIFLIGSDVISFHQDVEFINPVIDQMANTGTKTLLFLGDVNSTNYTNGNVTIDFQPFSFLTGSADLSGYSAVYVDSPFGCCGDPGPTVSGFGGGANLAAFVAGGGNLGIGDFWGDDFWDPILGFDAGPGVTTGVGEIICEDPGVSTPGGIAFGFKPSYTEGCFNHQSYDPAFWAAKGYFALQTNGFDGQYFGDWVTMATGFRDPGEDLPEPVTLSLFAMGAAAGALRWRRSAKR